MALTETQRADVRFYCGWSARFRQFDSRLEQAMNALASTPETEALVTNAIGGTPPGLLACLRSVDAELTAAHKRLKASKVGSIELNRNEVAILREEGRRHVSRLCALLGVEQRADVFGSSVVRGFEMSGNRGCEDNYIGK